MKTPVPSTAPASKDELYRHICDQLQQLLADERNLIANAANTAALLFRQLPDVNWAGFYLAGNGTLVLGPFQGAPACTRIPFGKGVCGTAAAERRSIVVPDVNQFGGHIACDPDSRSEIAIPLLNWGKLLGVLDVDSTTLNRFDDEDREGLESVAAVFIASLATDDLPDLSAEAAQQDVS
jgi:L-methionine (R)-S-oxide reductase